MTGDVLINLERLCNDLAEADAVPEQGSRARVR